MDVPDDRSALQPCKGRSEARYERDANTEQSIMLLTDFEFSQEISSGSPNSDPGPGDFVSVQPVMGRGPG